MRNTLTKLIYGSAIAITLVIIIAGIAFLRTMNRTQIQFDIHQNKQLIYLSTFAEPPQFAIWLENPETSEIRTVFVTHRVGEGDWEGKPNVPVALPKWFELFRKNEVPAKAVDGGDYDGISGATPKEDYFSVRAEVEPGSTWICWIEMNLAGDYNESFPELDLDTFEEDEFACGQPALLFADTIKAEIGIESMPVIVAQSIWEDGQNRVEPVNEGVTTARDVFDDIQISVIRPKPKLIGKASLKAN